MTVTAPTYAARIVDAPGVPIALVEDSGRITLDSSRAPHIEATVDLSITEASVLDDLDPRDSRRIVIDAGGRSFDLGIREVTPNREDARVTVRLASDEALLSDYAQLVDDKGPRSHEASLRAVVDYVLDKIDATLEPGATDADATAYWEVTNLIPNPSIELNFDGWIAGSGSGTLVRTAIAAAPAGAYALRWSATASQSNIVPATKTTDYSVQPGRWYVFSAYVVSQVGRTAAAVIQWWSSNGAVLSSQSIGTPVFTNSVAFQRVYVIAQAPAGASHMYPYVRTTGNTIGNQHYVDCAQLYEGDELVDYFDPTMSIPGYDVEWADVAHSSTSTRIPHVDRPPASLVWSAGISGLEFLHPLVQTAGLRLVCNERREWTLRDAGYREPGTQTFRDGVNIITADEQLTREADEWFDGAVYVYTWTDDDGIEQTRTDAYALTPNPTKVIRREISAAYPGPGRAAYAVQRAQGKGRTVTGTKQATWQEQAEQTFSAILSGTPIQVGIAERVVFDLSSNEVTTTSRTTDTPADAWVLIPSGEAWLDSPVGESWKEEVI